MTTRIDGSLFVLFPMALAAAACTQPVDGAPAPTESAAETAQALTAHEHRGAVITMTNDRVKNEIVVLVRDRDGALTAAGAVATGGAGSGDGLGSQGALARSGEWLFAVNAGSNDVTTFALRREGPVAVARSASGGTRPISITVHDRIVYVLNAGGAGNIAGFWIKDDGALEPLAGSTQPLSGAAVGPAQVAFAPDGDTLVVTEKATSKVDAYFVDGRARAHGPFVAASNGTTPFGFGFTPRGALVVSEAFGGAAGKAAVSSYRLSREVDVASLSASVADGQTAACWIAIGSDGRYAFTTNAASGNVSSYRVERDGRIVLAEAVAGVVGDGTHPTDMAESDGGDFLYVLSAGKGTVTGFEVHGGSLTRVGASGALPSTAAGLVAW
jgi:6-phosphogluconolactonase (cycloisomerase 2 family)